jgi:alkanesulfonate monooxygenase SsuD/methylene tetrahydromethanopterin reductase-like flavin-dependent oxidoreductase (luciferase family)
MRIHFVFQPDSGENLARQGMLAEELGFDAVWTANTLSARAPFIALAILARESSRIRLGPVAVSPFEQHPLKIASSLLTLNELAHGRANLVVGGGGGTIIGMGLKPQRTANYPRMVRGVRECVELLRRAAAGEPMDYEGELFRVHGYAPTWAKDPPPQLYIAANKPQMLRLAGEIGDGVMLSDIDLPFLSDTLSDLRRGLTRGGRPRAQLRVNNLIAWHVKPDREAAFTEARRMLWVRGIWERARIEPYLSVAECDLVQKSLPAWQKAYAEGSPTIPGVPQKIVDTLVDHMTLTGDYGDLDRLTRKLLAFRDAGVDEISLRLYGEPEVAIRQIAAAVVPALD